MSAQYRTWFLTRPLVFSAVALALAALVLYVATLAPTITWENGAGDSGELAAVAVTLGLAHPTGYPLYILLGHLATALPGLEPARALNLLSALLGACAVALVGLLGSGALLPADRGDLLVTARLAGLLTAGIALALAPLFWTQAVVTETRTLAAALMAVTLLCLRATWVRRFPAPLTALAMGLALADHLMALVLVPSVALVVALRLHGPREALTCLMLFLAGPLLYLYLPLRAAAQPALDWGDPQTIDRFLWVISGAQYHGMMVTGTDARLLTAWSGLPNGLGLPVVALAALGWGLVLRRSPFWAFVLGLPIVLSVGLVTVYQAPAAPYYLLPAILLLAALAGTGLTVILTTGRTRMGSMPLASMGRQLVLLGLLVALGSDFLVQARAGYEAVGASAGTQARRFGTSALESMRSGGVALVQGDSFTFSLWYARYGLGQRPDTLTVNVDLLRWPWYARTIAAQLSFSAAQRAVFLQPVAGDAGSAAAEGARIVLLARAVLPARPLYTLPLQSNLLGICRQTLDTVFYRCYPHPVIR